MFSVLTCFDFSVVVYRSSALLQSSAFHLLFQNLSNKIGSQLTSSVARPSVAEESRLIFCMQEERVFFSCLWSHHHANQTIRLCPIDLIRRRKSLFHNSIDSGLTRKLNDLPRPRSFLRWLAGALKESTSCLEDMLYRHHYACSIEKTFLQDFLEILQNFSKILKKCFSCYR